MRSQLLAPQQTGNVTLFQLRAIQSSNSLAQDVHRLLHRPAAKHSQIVNDTTAAQNHDALGTKRRQHLSQPVEFWRIEMRRHRQVLRPGCRPPGTSAATGPRHRDRVCRCRPARRPSRVSVRGWLRALAARRRAGRRIFQLIERARESAKIVGRLALLRGADRQPHSNCPNARRWQESLRPDAAAECGESILVGTLFDRNQGDPWERKTTGVRSSWLRYSIHGPTLYKMSVVTHKLQEFCCGISRSQPYCLSAALNSVQG